MHFSNKVVIWLPRKSIVEYARFGLILEHLGVQTWLDPAPEVRGMGGPPRMLVEALEID